MDYSKEEKAIIFLDSFLMLKKEQKAKIYESLKNLTDIYENVEKCERVITEAVSTSAYETIKLAANENYLNYVLSGLEKRNIKILTIVSEKYPQRLKESLSPPLILYLKGNEKLLDKEKAITIVGSRKTAEYIIKTVNFYAETLTENGVAIVTGVAEGLETALIKTALKSKMIIVVLPNGFDNYYPASNRSLIDSVAENGLLVSEYSPEIKALPHFFRERNRILATLTNTLLVCSGDEKSGTKNTASHARENGRTIFAFPYSLNETTGKACNSLIKDGCLLCDSVEEIMLELGIKYGIRERAKKLSTDELKVLSIILEGEAHINELITKTGKKVYELAPILSALEIKNFIAKNAGNTYSAVVV